MGPRHIPWGLAICPADSPLGPMTLSSSPQPSKFTSPGWDFLGLLGERISSSVRSSGH